MIHILEKITPITKKFHPNLKIEEGKDIQSDLSSKDHICCYVVRVT